LAIVTFSVPNSHMQKKKQIASQIKYFV